MHILFSFTDNRIVGGMHKNNSALTFHLDRGILTKHIYGLLRRKSNVLLTPKKQAKFIWPSVVLLCIKMQHAYLCNKVVNNQTPSPRLGVSLLRENTNIFTNVSYLCILHILRIQNIQVHESVQR